MVLTRLEYLISCMLHVKAPLCVRLQRQNTKRSKHWFYMESFIYKLSQRDLQTMNLTLGWCKQMWQPLSAQLQLTHRPPRIVKKYTVYLLQGSLPQQCLHMQLAVNHRTPLTVNVKKGKSPHLQDWHNKLQRDFPQGRMVGSSSMYLVQVTSPPRPPPNHCCWVGSLYDSSQPLDSCPQPLLTYKHP